MKWRLFYNNAPKIIISEFLIQSESELTSGIYGTKQKIRNT